MYFFHYKHLYPTLKQFEIKYSLHKIFIFGKEVVKLTHIGSG